MKVMVTGADCLFGPKFVELALKNNLDVYSCYHQKVPFLGHPVEIDLIDRDRVRSVFESVSRDIVVHAAALTSVDFCESNKAEAYAVNVGGTRNIVENCIGNGAYPVYISSDYVFSGDSGPYIEGDSCNPKNYYGFIKFQTKRVCQKN